MAADQLHAQISTSGAQTSEAAEGEQAAPGETSQFTSHGAIPSVSRSYSAPPPTASELAHGDAVPPADAAAAAIDHKGAGESVDAGIAKRVAGQTGVDVTGARVHSDPRSRDATHAMQARAFAFGNDVFLGAASARTTSG